ncbi:MAG: hypothetical protein H6604_09020 [Flavobacteriales bacterium]|nr:hypothetical protein [Flavobacteriales bacterium]
MKTKTRILIIPILSLLFFTFYSCRKDFEYNYSNTNLRFSKDTLFLDTIFNEVRSQTYMIRVYNTEDKDVLIRKIALEKNPSYYKINVDGKAGNEFYDVPIRSKDSLHIFVEIGVENEPNESIVEENLLFEKADGTNQHITLLSVAEDVEFFKPNTDEEAYIISENTTWNNSKPKLIFDELQVVNNAKLTIEEGTKIYFHRDSRLRIEEGSELEINGTKEKEVLFRGDRHDIRYDTLFGNWNQIFLDKNTKAKINYAKIQGGQYGLVAMKNANVEINNSKIFNHENIGILAFDAIITGENLVFNQCGESCFAGFGGNYEFSQSTFANYARFKFSSSSVYLANSYINSDDELIDSTIDASFGNCILYGRNREMFVTNFTDESRANYSFDTCLIRTEKTDNPNFINCIFNEDPLFKNTNMSSNLLRLLEESPAIGIGSVLIASEVPLDIEEKDRTIVPNLGAYQ